MIYRFKCDKCNYEETQILQVEERNKEYKCPHCNEGTMKRIISSSPDFYFKKHSISQDTLTIEDKH